MTQTPTATGPSRITAFPKIAGIALQQSDYIWVADTSNNRDVIVTFGELAQAINSVPAAGTGTDLTYDPATMTVASSSGQNAQLSLLGPGVAGLAPAARAVALRSATKVEYLAEDGTWKTPLLHQLDDVDDTAGAAPIGKVLGTTAVGVWGPIDAPAGTGALDGLSDVAAPATTPAGKVLGTTAQGVWGPIDAPSSLDDLFSATPGPWESATAFPVDAVVQHGGKTWLALRASTGVEPTAANALDWQDITIDALAKAAAPLPIASPTVLGGVKVGETLKVAADGTLDAMRLESATINVSPVGTASPASPLDAANGGLGQPFALLSQALEYARAHPNIFNISIRVAAGTYLEPMPLKVQGYGDILITGAGSSATIIEITSPGKSAVVYNGSVGLESLKIKNTSAGADVLYANPKSSLLRLYSTEIECASTNGFALNVQVGSLRLTGACVLVGPALFAGPIYIGSSTAKNIATLTVKVDNLALTAVRFAGNSTLSHTYFYDAVFITLSGVNKRVEVDSTGGINMRAQNWGGNPVFEYLVPQSIRDANLAAGTGIGITPSGSGDTRLLTIEATAPALAQATRVALGGVMLADAADITAGTPGADAVVDAAQLKAVRNASVQSDVTGITGATRVANMVAMTQAAYDALAAKDAATFYAIVP